MDRNIAILCRTPPTSPPPVSPQRPVQQRGVPRQLYPRDFGRVSDKDLNRRETALAYAPEAVLGMCACVCVLPLTAGAVYLTAFQGLMGPDHIKLTACVLDHQCLSGAIVGAPLPDQMSSID